MRNFPYQNQFLLKGSSRSNTNRLANLKSNPVVKAAIQRDKDIKTTQRSANIFYGIGASLLLPGGFLTGIGRKAIGQAFKKAGTAGNRKGADTVGNRIKQAESLLKFKTGKTVNYDKTAIPRSVVSTSGKNNPNTFVGSYIGTFQQKKTGRILEKAVNQGPAKFFSKFSKGRNNPKTGVIAGKRKYNSPRRKDARYEKDQYEAGLEDSRGPYSEFAEDYNVLKNQFNKSLLRRMQPKK